MKHKTCTNTDNIRQFDIKFAKSTSNIYVLETSAEIPLKKFGYTDVETKD